MSVRVFIGALGLVLLLQIAAGGQPARAAQTSLAAAALMDKPTLKFVDKPELLRLAGRVEKLMNATVEGVSGSETFVYLNAQWMQLVLNAALKQAVLLEYLQGEKPGLGGLSIMELMARDSASLYQSYLDYNMRNIDEMIKAHAGAKPEIKALLAELDSIYTDAANLYRDMELRRDRQLGRSGK